MQKCFEKKIASIQSEQFLIIRVRNENKTRSDVVARQTKHLIVPDICELDSFLSSVLFYSHCFYQKNFSGDE